MKHLVYGFLALILLISACGENKPEAEELVLPEMLAQGTTPLDLNEYDLPFVLYIPDSSRGIPDVMPSSFGETHISVGPTYQVIVAEGGNLAEFKTAMSEDLLYVNTIVDEGADYVLYKSEIEGAFLEPEYHFYAVKPVGNTTFEFHDYNDEGGYSERVAQFMLESINFIQPTVDAPES